jgi:hypothetical protein
MDLQQPSGRGHTGGLSVRAEASEAGGPAHAGLVANNSTGVSTGHIGSQ